MLWINIWIFSFVSITEGFNSWLSLGWNKKNVNINESCTNLKHLVSEQKMLCREEPKSVKYAIEGLQYGLKECQKQFKFERWNCSLQSVKVLTQIGTRETAYIYAISSAAVTHSISRACSAANLTTCSCSHPSKMRRRKRNENMDPFPSEWEWGGCSDNIKYGLQYGKKFVDAPEENTHESSRELRSLVNLHNNEAGRRMVSRMMKTYCQCHGVSGACAIRTCWRELSPFKYVAKELKALYYKSSVLVSRRRGTKLRPADRTVTKRSLSRHKLVYLQPSPDFCSANKSLGTHGVKDRECNRTSSGVDGCSALCCGRGYNTQILEEEERCYCKFHWCCHVSCKTCHITREIYTCK